MKTEDLLEMKPRPVVAKRPSKKKPKDKPKRPLVCCLALTEFGSAMKSVPHPSPVAFFSEWYHQSAYNFFFKAEREKILKVVLAEDPSKVQTDPEAEDYLVEDQIKKLKKEGGKVSFEEMGKLIGARWKNIDPDRLTRFSELATEDTDRYKKEMVSYNGRQEAKMRSEALSKPSPGYAGREMKPGDGSARISQQQGYPEMGSNAPGMGQGGGGYAYQGVDFSGYAAMPMANMYSYGGNAYGGMGAAGAGGQGMMGIGGQNMDGSPQYGGGGGMYSMMGGAGGFQGGMMYAGQGPMGYDPHQQQGGVDPNGQGQAGMYSNAYGQVPNSWGNV
jgi:HMG-box domain